MTESAEGFSPRPETPRNIEVKLPEARIFDLLAAFGNGENKALELIVMREGYSYSDSAIYNETMDHQAKNKRWDMNRSLPFAHCERSLSPIGLVTKEALRSDDTAWGYQITRYGIETGIPFAGALLKWSYEHPDHSLYKMFGSTTSTSVKDEQALDKKRSPETRYRIFWEIATSPSNKIRLTDIVNETSEERSLIGAHLRSINKNNVVTYNYIDKGRQISFYKRAEKVPDKDPEPYQRRNTLSTRVWDLLSHPTENKTSEYLSTEEIINSLINRYPEYEDLQRESFSRNTSSILSTLEKQGYAQREKFSHFSRSELTLTEGQREAVVSLVTVIDKFMSGDREAIDKGRRFAQRASSDPSLYSDLMLKAKVSSPFANATNREDTAGWLIYILQEHPNSTAKQIQQFLESDYDKRLNTHPIRNHLSRLINEEKIVAEKTKSGNTYRVAASEDLNNTAQSDPLQN
jgi:hypothetical protein